MRYAIVPADESHVAALVKALRAADREEIRCFGFGNAWAAVIGELRASWYARTGIVDGEIAAMWGATGEVIGEARPWLLTSPVVERVPVAMLKEGRREVQAILGARSALSGHVHARYTQAVKFLRLLGFTLGDAEPFGPTGEMFLPYRMEA